MTEGPETGITEEPPTEFRISVAAVEDIAKTVIKAAAYHDRWPMWDAFGAAIKDAAASCTRYPWERPEDITELTAPAALRALRAMLRAVADPGERSRLAVVAALEAEKAEDQIASGSGKNGPGSWLPRCRWCGEPCKDKRAKYCSPAHRNYAWRRREKNKRERRQPGDDSSLAAVVPSS